MESTITPDPLKPNIPNGFIGTDKQRSMMQGDHEMAKMGLDGDTKTIWDKSNPDEVANARNTFNDLKAKGYRAYHCVGKGGTQGEPMNEFDPDIERMIMGWHWSKPIRTSIHCKLQWNQWSERQQRS